MASDIEPWVTLKEIAAHLQISEDTVHRWIANKGMPATKAGRVWRFKASAVDAWLASGAAANGVTEQSPSSHPGNSSNQSAGKKS